jgi:exocyst complex component 7
LFFFKLKDKDRQIIKDHFNGFNREFEAIYETQRQYFIPAGQNELAVKLRGNNNLIVISQYKRFYQRYATINFATNRDKYVKYTPEELERRMNEFFTG